MSKTVKELTREEMTELKGNYMVELANQGRFAEVMNRNYDSPDWDDMANADKYVPDEVIFKEYADTIFVEDDFACNYVEPDFPTLDDELEAESNRAETEYFNR